MSRTDYVYRMVPGPSDARPPEGMAFVTLSRVSAAIKWFGALRAQFGLFGAAKTIAKIATGKRIFFAFEHGGQFVSYVWSTEHAPKYAIDTDACVLGPMHTQKDMRRKGLASTLLVLATVRLAARGYRAVYIDTVPTNVVSQRTILRAGFTPYAVVRDGVMHPVKPGEAFETN